MANISIALEKNGVTTLSTGGKFCDKNVDIDAGTVYENGKQAERNAFWDTYQANGNRDNYDGAFGGEGWTTDLFQPKYDIQPTSAAYMFRKSNVTGDLVEICNNLGIALDFSNCTIMTELFSNAKNITRVGTVDISKCGSNNAHAFSFSGIKTIDKLVVAETNQMMQFPGTATQLENVVIEGTIGTTSPTWLHCPNLTKASITSIINALSSAKNGLSVTIPKTAKETVFTEEEWSALIATKPNWTIALA